MYFLGLFLSYFVPKERSRMICHEKEKKFFYFRCNLFESILLSFVRRDEKARKTNEGSRKAFRKRKSCPETAEKRRI